MADDRMLSAGSQFNEEKSPFRPPNDEEVFVTRETEKQKRKDDQAEKKAARKTERDMVKAAKKPQKKTNSDQEQVSKQKKGKDRIYKILCIISYVVDRWSEYSKEKASSSAKLHTCSK